MLLEVRLWVCLLLLILTWQCLKTDTPAASTSAAPDALAYAVKVVKDMQMVGGVVLDWHYTQRWLQGRALSGCMLTC